MICLDTCIPPKLAKCFPSASEKLASTMEFLILIVALVVATDIFAIGIAVSDLVITISIGKTIGVRVPVPADCGTAFLVVAPLDTSIIILIGSLALTQSMPREFPQ
jgi:hypothetical protein